MENIEEIQQDLITNDIHPYFQHIHANKGNGF
jgi:hypothetical protein